MHKYKLVLEFDGTAYRGWQLQTNARSIQGELLEAAERLLGGKVEIQGAGRTDAGVHALGQVAHLTTAVKMRPQAMRDALNDLLPANINILQVQSVPMEFHARHHARSRSYIYLVSRRKTAFGKRYVWWIKDELNVKEMQSVLALFRGFHDFASFADKRRDKQESTLVDLRQAELFDCNGLLIFRFVGSHFLWRMVRRLVGVTVEAGKGKLSPAAIGQMLFSESDLPARMTAPASGLFLEYVQYETSDNDKGDFFQCPLEGYKGANEIFSGGKAIENNCNLANKCQPLRLPVPPFFLI